jgi:cytochrome o ubiquinol oxidase subunit 1
MADWILGRLPAAEIVPLAFLEDPSVNTLVASGAASLAVLGAVAVPVVLTWFGLWRRLWTDWLTTVDHKKIGIMYVVLGLVMMARGVIEGAVMRGHQATALDGGVLSAHHYAELFSTHGTIMIFFVAMPFIVGFMNFLVPLQIGARDVAFPMLNQLSLALTAAGAALVMASLVIGEFHTGGWSAYPPFTGSAFQPGVGPDYWIWAIVIAGLGSTLSGINFVVTIYKNRAPGMTYMRMPIFVWTALVTSVLIVFALPPLTVAALFQALDRYLDFNFFTNDLGGNMMNYANLFWLFGHPEVYILILPAYGIFSELTATFAAKRIYGYHSLVAATVCIAVLSFTVWLHHFFTMGQSSTINVAFGIATMLIAIPTGVKVYVWMATMWRGRIRMTVPIIYLIGFLMLFVIGGVSGIVLANPTVNFQVHNTLFIVAHFHNVILPGVVFAILAGMHMWFPKAFGFRLDEGAARLTAFLWIAGFMVTFLPLYIVGILGMPRRSAAFEDPDFVPYMLVTAAGAAILLSAFAMVAVTIWISVRNRERLAAPLGDPWDGRTLEWATPSPPPEYNFPVIPEVAARDAFAVEKAEGRPFIRPERYEDIRMPAPSVMGILTLASATVIGFALTFWIFWLAALAFVFIAGAFIVRSFFEEAHVVIPAEEVRRANEAWISRIEMTRGVTRDEETSPENRGFAATDMVMAA